VSGSRELWLGWRPNLTPHEGLTIVRKAAAIGVDVRFALFGTWRVLCGPRCRTIHPGLPHGTRMPGGDPGEPARGFWLLRSGAGGPEQVLPFEGDPDTTIGVSLVAAPEGSHGR
jgi:hypothetical protein